MANFQREETEKLYYSISEVSEMLDIVPSTIRFWEKEFDQLKPTKNKKGNRLFTKKDIEHLQAIVLLVKEKGYTIQGAKEQLKQKNTSINAEASVEVITKLKEIKEKLQKIKDSL
jgi:DNA-binding transcriptional MerR regulator